LKRFTGHAQPQEGATEVLVSDVMSYVSRKIPPSAKTDWGTQQEPDFQVSGNFPIALLLGGKGLGKGQPAPDPLEEIPVESSLRVIHRMILEAVLTSVATSTPGEAILSAETRSFSRRSTRR